MSTIPGAVTYRADPLFYLLGRMLVTVKFIGIANLLLGEAMYPEYIQGAATPAALAAELRACADGPARRERTAAQAARLRSLLAQPAKGTAADWLARAGELTFKMSHGSSVPLVLATGSTSFLLPTYRANTAQPMA